MQVNINSKEYIDDINNMKRTFYELPQTIQIVAIAAGLLGAARKAAIAYRRIVPVKTGRLKGSIKAKVIITKTPVISTRGIVENAKIRSGARVYSSTNYAHMLEYGTQKMSPKGYFAKALDISAPAQRAEFNKKAIAEFSALTAALDGKGTKRKLALARRLATTDKILGDIDD